MYERSHHTPLSRARFVRRILGHFAVAILLLCISIAIGMLGYSHYEGLAWRDGFVNAAMLLGGMGPVNMPQTDGGKVFAGLYALYAGLLFLIVTSLILAPVVHRILHKFHWAKDS